MASSETEPMTPSSTQQTSMPQASRGVILRISAPNLVPNRQPEEHTKVKLAGLVMHATKQQEAARWLMRQRAL